MNTRPHAEYVGITHREPADGARQDWIADYLATKYGVAQVAPLLLKIYLFIEERGRPADSDTLDRWLIEDAANARRPQRVDPPPPPMPPHPKAVVYYVRFADRVKIGTTCQFRRRLASIPHDEVLAIEPGSYELERQRHVQFAHLRIRPNSEWFHHAPEIDAHIATLKERP